MVTTQEIKRRHGDGLKRLLSNSGIVSLKDLNTFVTVNLPIPPPPHSNKIKRPTTGNDLRSRNGPISVQFEPAVKTRPKTSTNKTVYRFFSNNFLEGFVRVFNHSFYAF